MPHVSTPSRRRLVMVFLLSIAVVGSVIRHFADNPSTLRDFGTLLMVMWLPAVGNLIAFLIARFPRKAAKVLDFPADPPFTRHLQAQLERVDLPPGWLASLPPGHRRGTLITGNRGYTVRLAEPLATLLALPGPQALALELLRPEAGVPELPPGTAIHLLVGPTAVARGRVVAPGPGPA